MKRIILAALVGVLFVSTGSSAGAVSGNRLYSDCREGQKGGVDSFIPYGACIGYIEAVLDISEGVDKGINGFKFCINKNVTSGQVRDIVLKWLEDNPQNRHFGASGLVAASLFVAFPCKK